MPYGARVPFYYQDVRPAGCRGAAPCRRLSVIFRLFVDRHKSFACAEQKRYAPNARKSDHGVYDSADQWGLTSAQPCDDIKSEKPDASPVQCADDGDEEGNSIHNHRHSSLNGCFPPDVSVNKARPIIRGIFWHFWCGVTAPSQKFTQTCENGYFVLKKTWYNKYVIMK